MTERTLIAVDIGGTKTAVAALRACLPRSGATAVELPAVLHQSVTPTVTASADACLAALVDAVATVAAAAGLLGGEGLDGVGVGVASMVDFAAGRVVASVNLPLRDVPLRDVLQERFDVPVVVDNDATVATVGEHAFGAGAGVREMLMLTLGTGVGGGIIAAGHPYRGHSGAAAELGHLIVDVDGPECPGRVPEPRLSRGVRLGHGDGRGGAAAAEAEPGSALGRALAAGETVDGPLLTRLAQAGDTEAIAVVTRVGEYLGAGLVTLVNVFNPELVVVGGGAAAAGELLLAPARRVLAARGLRPQRDEVRVVPARFGNDAGVVGAAALALTELF